MRITIRLQYSYLLFLLLFAAHCMQAQPGPVAKFSFNDGSDHDEVSGRPIKTASAHYVEDRFGNKNSAVYINGSRYSYVNLGTYPALKPKTGSISLWFNVENSVWSGTGPKSNPILLTKSTPLSDFYEAYAIYYFLETGKICIAQAKDSTCQVNLFSQAPVDLNRWNHIVISYTDSTFTFYLNNRHESRVKKAFESVFLESDSVMLGNTANQKNQRFMIGSVDDIEFYDYVLSPEEVEALYNAPNPNKTTIIINRLMIAAAIAVFILLLYFYIKYRVATAVKAEKERSEQINIRLENELRIHRAQMNPHFIFNTLNGLQDLILKKEYDDANDYLVKFSELLRKILESNMSDVITLELEIELLKRYIEIEAMRFEENFSYSIVIDPSIPQLTIIPIMMLQPFVENALWHGLLPKEGDKSVSISFEPHEGQYLKCRIEDNGVGRTEDRSKKKKSMATLFIRQRLELLNKIHKLHCSLHIEDLPGGGTRVTIILPVLNGH